MTPMDCAYPFRQQDFERYVSYLIDPEFDMYEYDGVYYLGPDACYGFTDDDFICLNEDRGLAIGLPPGVWNVMFPPAAHI